MNFTKMHGLGNNYVYVDCFEQDVPDPVALARVVCDRHTGIGGDGLILIRPSQSAQARMEMYNADGSRAQMCGNGLRCLAKYVVDHGRAAGPDLRLDTDSGVKEIRCFVENGRVCAVRVDMGEPSLEPASLPCTVAGPRVTDYPIEAGGRRFQMTCVSMGNPHAVMFEADLSGIDLAVVGPAIECHEV